MYRAGIEGLLGLTRAGPALTFDPCFPSGWPQMQATLNIGTSQLRITIDNEGQSGRGIATADLNGTALEVVQSRLTITLPAAQDVRVHRLKIKLRDRA